MTARRIEGLRLAYGPGAPDTGANPPETHGGTPPIRGLRLAIDHGSPAGSGPTDGHDFEPPDR
ncbi:MAG TPA: hypothetical protein VLB73_00590 [Patescibacteria group bacterium]|nr:hypothetical protein [Patescibacteria group bacterium]